MANIRSLQTNFTAGEISPKVRGRVDIARYQNGAARLRNVLVNVYGGAERTPGTLMVAPVKAHADRPRLIPFIYNRDISYVLEFGPGYMRVFRSGAGRIIVGGVPYEISTPFTANLLPVLRFAQKDDTLFMVDGVNVPRMLQRVAEDSWRLIPVPFVVLPFAETGWLPPYSLIINNGSVGSGRLFTSGGDTFFPSDVGRRILAGPGIATITGYINVREVWADVNADFSRLSEVAGDWTLADSPQAPIKPSSAGTPGQTIDLTFQTITTPGTTQPIKAVESQASTATPGWIRYQITAHGYSSGDIVRFAGFEPTEYNLQAPVQVIDSNNFEVDIGLWPRPTVLGTAQKIATASVTSTSGWRPSDVGSYVRINGGLVRITEVVSVTLARGVVRQDLTSDVEAPASAWTLEQAVWGVAFGNPRAVTINQQRLVFGGTRRDPNGVWGSRTGLYFDFTLGTNDDDGFFYALDGESNGIQHLASLRALLAFSLGTEWTLVGGIEKPLTPTNVQAKDQSVYGSGEVRPVRVADEMLYLQRSGRRVLAMAYNGESDSYRSPDLTVLCEHLLSMGVVSMSYQQDPASVLWCVCSDGSLATMTFSRDEGVIAWTRQETDGFFEDVCVVPNGADDEVWVLVRREIGGQVRRYIEKFAASVFMHSAVQGTSEAGSDVWGGLDHLEGKQIIILADGTAQTPRTVVGGEVTLSRPANEFQAGLEVIPEISLLPPEVGSPSGSVQGSRMSSNKVEVLFLNTSTAEINGQEVIPRKFGENVLDRPPPTVSGWAGVSHVGWEKGRIEAVIRQPNPMPFHVLAVVREWTSNA